MEKVLLVTSTILLIISIYTVAGLLIAVPVMVLWNWVIPDVLHLPAIGYWQAYGLTLLCTILFQSNSSRSTD